MINIPISSPPWQIKRVGGGNPERAFPGRVPPAPAVTASGVARRPASPPQPALRNAKAQQQGPPVLSWGPRGATNPKNVAARRPLSPPGFPLARCRCHSLLASPSPLAGGGSGRGRLRARRWLGPRPRLCSKRRGGRGAGRAGGEGPGRAAGSAAGPCGAGAGGGAGGPQPEPTTAARHLPRRLPGALPRAAARPAGRDARCRPAPLRPAGALEQKVWGAGGRLPPPAPMTAQGLLLPSLDCDLPPLPRS